MVTALLFALSVTPVPVNGTAVDRVRAAIIDAVRERMGASAEVTIDHLAIDADVDAPALRALPEPGSQLGRVMRFTLKAAGDRRSRTGSATAHVRVAVDHAHAIRHLDRGVELTAGDVVAARHEIGAGALRALPTASAAAHARAIRPIPQDACVTAPAITSLPAVRGGHDVVAIARIGEVEATATVTAAENGDAGSVIRVVNRQTKRPLKARVLSAGLVEIIHD